MTASASVQPETLDEATAKFIAMGRVVDGVRAFDRGQFGTPDDAPLMLAGVAGRRRRSQRVLDSRTSKLLRVTWQTELAAHVGEQLDDPGLRLATLQTLPVQAYYAVFNAARAFTTVAGSPRDRHAELHRTFEAEHCRWARGAWAVKLAGDPAALESCELTPMICTPVSFNPMEIRFDDAEYVWAALRMTRRWKLALARERWIADARNRTKAGAPYKKLPAGRAALLAADERATTLLDFLYELRCATNYRTVDEYAVDVDDAQVALFHRGLLSVMDSGLLLYEALVASTVGVKTYQSELEAWTRTVRLVGDWSGAAPRTRAGIIAAAI